MEDKSSDNLAGDKDNEIGNGINGPAKNLINDQNPTKLDWDKWYERNRDYDVTGRPKYSDLDRLERQEDMIRRRGGD